MKRFLLVFTLIFISVFFVGCDKGTTEPNDTRKPSETETTVDTYEIRWEVNGIIIEEDLDVEEGITPSFNGLTPTKESTAQYDYIFDGWSPEISNAATDTTYIAQFIEIEREYTVSFNVDGGVALSEVELTYGDSLNEVNDPTKDGYRFIGWYYDSSLTDAVSWPILIQEDLILYAAWVELVPYGTYLTGLLTGYTINPYSYLPENMIPGNNLIFSSQATIDYSGFVNLESIPFGGYGEQWNMVVGNIEQSMTFFNVLSVVDTLTSLSVATFTNYLDSNPADTAHYNFVEGIYSISISFEDGIISYIIDYTATLPVFGESTVQIALSQDIETGEKIGRIQIGDANAMRYIMTENNYQFAIKYAGLRRAYLELTRDNEGNVSGSIFEYLGVDGVFSTGSAAQFFIDEDYVSVVGNKSSSMTGWTGMINELYDANTGDLLGYEVQETLSSITYNTLWFNLNDCSGITSIKVLEAPLENSNPYLIYVNSNEDVFSTKTVGGLSLKALSRRFDIELRTQYFYYVESDILYEVEMLVPMIFVQQEQLSTFVSDVNSVNSYLDFSFTLSTLVQNKIIEDYETLLPDFAIQKDEFSEQDIIDFIGVKY